MPRGRPLKAKLPDPCLFDLERVTALRIAVREVIDRRDDARGLTEEQRVLLAAALADQLLMLPADKALACSMRKGEDGPKPRIAELALLARTREVLAEVGICPTQWVNDHARKDELREWCLEFLRAAGLRGFPLSDGSARSAAHSTSNPVGFKPCKTADRSLRRTNKAKRGD